MDCVIDAGQNKEKSGIGVCTDRLHQRFYNFLKCKMRDKLKYLL